MNRKKKKNKSKRKLLILAIFIVIILIALFIVNKFIPVENIKEDELKISLSTTKITGDNVRATISSKKRI